MTETMNNASTSARILNLRHLNVRNISDAVFPDACTLPINCKELLRGPLHLFLPRPFWNQSGRVPIFRTGV